MPDELIQELNKAQIGNKGRELRISADTAEKFRSELTEHWARVGFGPDYKPTSEGMMIEDMIDKFHIDPKV